MADDIASVGIKIETRDIDRANVSLDTLAGKGASVDQSLGKIEGAAAKAGKSLDNLGRGAQSAAGIGDVGAKAQHAAQGIRAVGDNAEKAGHGVKSMAASMGGFGDVLSGIAMKAAAAAGAFVSLNKAFDAAAQWTDMSNRLKMVADGTDGLARAQAEVVRIAQSTRAPLEATAQLYQRIAQQQDALGMSTSRVAGVVETVSKAMALSGVSAGAANAALVQFGQALASGVLRGDELNSILEQAPGLAMALADGLGTTTGKLREMGVQGKLTADMVVGALEKQAAAINEQFGKMAPTVSQALTNVNTSFTQFIGKMDEALGLTSALARSIDFVAKNFDTLATILGGAAIVGAVAAFGGLSGAIAAAGAAAVLLGGLLLTPIGLAVAAVVGLTAGYIAFKEELEGTGTQAITLGDIFGQVGQDIAEALGFADSAAKQAAAANADAAKNVTGYWEKAIKTIADVWDMLASIIPATALGVARAIGNVANVLTDAFAKAFNWIAEKAEALINKVVSGVNAATKFIPFVPTLGQVSFGRMDVSGARFDIGGEFARGFSGGTMTNARDAADAFFNRIRDRSATREANRMVGEGEKQWAQEEAAQLRKVTEAQDFLNQKRIEALKVNKDYQQQLEALVTLREAGMRGEAGGIGEDEYIAKVKELAKATWESSAAGKADADSKKSRAKASDDAAKAAEREVKAYQAFLNGLREKIAGQELELQNGKKLSAADRERLELEKLLANGRFQMTESRKAEIEAGLKRLDQLDQEREKVQRAVEAYQEWVDTQQELARAEVEASKGREAASRAIDEYIAGVVESQELLKLEASTVGMTSEKRAVALAQMRVELELRKKIAQINANPNGNPEWRALEIERVTQWAQVEKVNAAQRAIYDEWQKTADSINQSLTDALMRGFEDGKGFASNFRDTLKNMFRTLVLRPVIQMMVAPVAGGLGSMMGGSAMAGQGGGGILGLASNASSAYNLATGGFGSMLFGNSIAYGAMVPGLSMGGAQAAMLAAQTGEFGLAGATATASAGGAGAGGFGALLSNPVTIAIGALAMLGLSGAFSRKHEQHNLQGTFGGASGFEGTWHDYYKGGLLRSSKTVDTPLDSATLNALRGAWKAQEAMVIDYAETLGLATDKIEGFTFKINLKLKDLGDPEAAGYMDKVWQMVNEAIATGSNEMAERILGTWTTTTREVEETIKTGFWDDETFTTVKKTVEETTYAASEYAREGERAIDTLTRLATSLQATNAAFDMLGLSLYEASLAGGDMASKLIDQMGGMDAFGAQVGAYWQNYYTEAERHAYMTAKMTEALAAAGLEMPTTVAGFRALVDAQDLTTDAGRAAFAALMSVNAAFTEVYGNADAAAGSIAGLGAELAALEPIVFGAASDLASVIEQGLLGTLTGAQLGEQMADVVMQGMYSAIAGGFSQQITALMVEGVLNPMIAAAMTGASMSAAVSQAAIDRVIQQAQAAAAAINAVLSDPGFQAAIQQVQAAVGSISVGIQRPEPIYDSYAAQNARALAAQREAERLAQQAAQEAQRAADEEARRQQGIMNERLGLTKQLLQLEGNTVLLRQIELEALDPSNRALQQRIWAIEDETAAAEKYKSALKDAQDFLGGFTKNIEEFIFKVSHAQADAQQSYQMAAAKFTAQMTLARGGDRDAMNGITGYADTLIGSIRRESTTGAEANLRIARVLGQLASLPKQISAEQLIVDAIVNANTSLETVLSTNFASLDANVDGLLTADELAASGLATNTQISALMARVDANGDGMISKQELANSRLQTLATEQYTTNTNLGNVTSAQNSTNSWLSQIQMADVGYSLSNVNAINAGAGATVAAINKTNAQIGTFNRNYDNPVTAQFSADSPLYSIFKGIDETNTWLYKLHGLSTASIQYWIAMLDNEHRPVTVTSLNRTLANGSVFADGGYTGPGAKWEPAGVVHKGEVVWSQADVARWGGPGIVDALRQGAPGYADGGPVAVRVPQIYVPPVGRSNEETQALLREVLAELRAQRSDDRARHSSLAEPLQRMDRRGAKWDKDGLPAERTNEAIA